LHFVDLRKQNMNAARALLSTLADIMLLLVKRWPICFS